LQVGNCPTLETERLIMRPFRESDTDAYHSVLQSGPVRRALSLSDTVSRDEAWQQMAAFLGQWELRNHGQWALVEKATGSFIGRAGPHRPERADWPGVEVGWTLHPAAWGKGYATEAGRAAVHWTFVNHPQIDTLYSVILPTNTPSQNVAKRLGYELMEERVLAFFPTQPHGIWILPRARWQSREAGNECDQASYTAT
jgi:RimJ/RimL family protein N-acetyltransferase